ncbi:MAG: hypothetical protein FVQ84_08530 [Planctomycetes bacterium]|nr:hypothetical protein [Planctomycetota bacterium]
MADLWAVENIDVAFGNGQVSVTADIVLNDNVLDKVHIHFTEEGVDTRREIKKTLMKMIQHAKNAKVEAREFSNRRITETELQGGIA